MKLAKILKRQMRYPYKAVRLLKRELTILLRTPVKGCDRDCFTKSLFFKGKLVTRHPIKYAHDSIIKKPFPLKLNETLNASIFVSSFLNFVQLGILHYRFT